MDICGQKLEEALQGDNAPGPQQAAGDQPEEDMERPELDMRLRAREESFLHDRFEPETWWVEALQPHGCDSEHPWLRDIALSYAFGGLAGMLQTQALVMEGRRPYSFFGEVEGARFALAFPQDKLLTCVLCLGPAVLQIVANLQWELAELRCLMNPHYTCHGVITVL